MKELLFLKFYSNDVDRKAVIGDTLALCMRCYAHRTWLFAKVVKITPTGKIRLILLNKVTVSKTGYDTKVTPGVEESGNTRLISSKRTYGKGTIAEWWDFYDETKEYVDHYDRLA